MPSRSFLMVAAFVASVIVLSATPPPAAHAYEPASSTATMAFTPMTRDNAAWAGYEVRIDEAGTEYAVPAGAAAGDRDRQVIILPAGARNTVGGDCGTSTVTFLSKTSIYTSYTIAPSHGAPVSHNWSITYSSPIDLSFQDLSGLAPWGSQTWSTIRPVTGQALGGQTLSAVAGGTVLTTYGYCSSGAPHASIAM